MERSNELEERLRQARRHHAQAIEELIDMTAALERVKREGTVLKNQRESVAATPQGGFFMNAEVAAVGKLLRKNSGDWITDLTICESTKVSPPGVYVAVRQMIEAGWLYSYWEEDVPAGEPRRRFYRLSPEGSTALPIALAQYDQQTAGKSSSNYARHPKEAPN
ncbi:hypothetical protein J8N05_46945 (plasmid) [Streptomyces sp. BH-SS-21]|uniref:PadR family transcriptional regulator n=1 Tax=Streptomyces liliiviolaceus TaxID=2823109 RepID=A0A940YF11_9ACTN|nr:hypothetical protein [Streptomyces liliiviolaceus]MBQ0855699.1 hypothetical protein [Streptomyces liliiviolaceus]